MKKFIFASLFISGIIISSLVSACPQAIRRERGRIIHRPVVERQVVREKEYYTAPVREHVILQQVEPECNTRACVQKFRRVERIRSNY